MPFKPAATAIDRAITVTINQSLHLFIDRTRLNAIHSWEWHGRYYIKFVMQGGNTTAEYDREDKWHAVLHELHKALDATVLASPAMVQASKEIFDTPRIARGLRQSQVKDNLHHAKHAGELLLIPKQVITCGAYSAPRG